MPAWRSIPRVFSSGHGAVDAALTAKAGSTIVADGDLALGRADRVDGVFSDGILMVGNHTVTLKDRNQAVLGSLTELGNGEGGGVLKADNGILLDFGRNLVGHGTVIGSILNNGYIEGVGPSADDYLELRGYVRGVGDFAGTIAFSGVFSPGLSPTDSNVENVVMLPTNLLEIEIGGRTAGSQFDRISASGFATLGGTLKVSLIDGFVPVLGDSFTFLLASNGITQQFSAFDFPTFGGLTFSLEVADVSATLRTVQAVPIPAALPLMLTGLLGLAAAARRPSAV